MSKTKLTKTQRTVLNIIRTNPQGISSGQIGQILYPDISNKKARQRARQHTKSLESKGEIKLIGIRIAQHGGIANIWGIAK